MDAVTQTPSPVNETVLDYAPGSAERAELELALARLGSEQRELPHTIGGRRVLGSGKKIDVRQPHAHRKVLGTMRNASLTEARDAVQAAKDAAPGWRALSFDDRAAVFLRAAELLSGPWRQTLNAATMLGQGKTCYQAEIDARASSSTSGGSTSTSPGRSWPSSRRSTARACGTAPTTARSRASSTRSRRSTSPPSPATCRPPRRSWATPSCGSRRRPRASRPS